MKKLDEKSFFEPTEFDSMVKIEEGTSSSVIASENNPKGLIF